MIKNKYLGLFILLLILLIFSRIFQKQTTKPLSPSTNDLIKTSILPSQTVINFYSSYFLYKGNLLSFDSYKDSKFLTDDFKTKLKKQILKNSSVNPIICKNEKPDEISVKPATISANLAEVLVTQTFQNIKSNQKVKLELFGNEYKIYDIICN